jgi:hypothetical protein
MNTPTDVVTTSVEPVTPGVRLVLPSPQPAAPEFEPSPLHEAIRAYLDRLPG